MFCGHVHSDLNSELGRSVLVPPVIEQEEIVRRVEALSKLAEEWLSRRLFRIARRCSYFFGNPFWH